MNRKILRLSRRIIRAQKKANRLMDRLLKLSDIIKKTKASKNIEIIKIENLNDVSFGDALTCPHCDIIIGRWYWHDGKLTLASIKGSVAKNGNVEIVCKHCGSKVVIDASKPAKELPKDFT